MKDLVLKIDVVLDEFMEVKGNCGSVTMITFHGDCDCKNFRGEILPGAADTQIEKRGELRTLSARYFLKGYDAEGKSCTLFIENNGVVSKEGVVATKPEIITDSECLAWLEQASLSGEIAGVDEKHIEILIWEEKK